MSTQVDAAFKVDAALADLGIDLTEAEYAQLLLACSVGGAPWPRVEAVLHRISRELTSLLVGGLMLGAGSMWVRLHMAMRGGGGL